jgi:DeoR/GlpR family transcriptional regulator of sugar metabolism
VDFLRYTTFCIFGVKIQDMIIEKTKDQILIKISPKVDAFGFQRIMDYLEYLEITSKSKAKQSDADKLANELNQVWWEKNKNSFIQ